MTQDRWPRGTPVAPDGRGPGGGRFRDQSPDWSRGRGIDALSAIDRGAHLVGSDWAYDLVDRIGQQQYRPGQWQQVDIQDHMAGRWSMLVDHLMSDGMREADARREASQMFHETRPPTRVYRNGAHELVIETDRELPEAQVLDHLDFLLERYPNPGGGPARVTISDGLKGGAETLRPDDDETPYSPSIILSSRDIFDRKALAGTSAFMPSYSNPKVPQWRYVLTHEWGHVQSAGMVLISDVELSDYGLSDPKEAVAEAFAEWVMSGGQTTNPAALAYRDHYGWGAP